MEFALGQRWVSQTEAGLGLGLITDISGRRVTVTFPAADDERTYAMDNAPLARVRYRVGETLENRDGTPLTVVDLEENEGLITYQCQDSAGEHQQVMEVALSPFARFVHPEQRLFCGQFDRNGDFALRYETLQHQARLQASRARGLMGTRTRLLNHQIAIADQVARRPSPRVLLADEAGLGKTIEAGMILHSQVLTAQADRFLILVPEALVHQWFVEMRRRFNLHFALFDRERIEALEEDGNPFESEQLILCPQELLSDDPQTLEQARSAGWDMLVVDEAHHLQWSPQGADPGYQAVETLSADIPGLLLLTATPQQVGLDSHFARLRLIDPARFSDLEHFRQEVETHGGLREQHRVLFRHTRADVGGFPERRVHPAPLTPEADYTEAATLNGEQGLFPETTLPEALWLELDPRVAWLETTLKQLRPEKVLVICAHAETARALEHHLHLGAGIRSAAFHEGLNIIERDRAAAWFADHEQGAQALICSEIGSEGRNFQFARHLILFDLPRNPDLLEQRIGRLDRIGQGEAIDLHVPYLEGSAQQALFRWYHEGLDALAHYCAVGVATQHEVEQSLQSALANPDAALDELMDATADARQKLEAHLEQERAMLATLSTDETEQAGALIERIRDDEQPQALSDYLTRVFDQYGVHHDSIGPEEWVIRPTEHLRTDHFPGLPDDGMSLTLDREVALAREDLAFLSWEHPMVQDTMAMTLDSEFGNAALITLQLKGVQPGTLMLEALYSVRTTAPRAVQIERFLPTSPTRLLLTSDGRDLSGMLSHDKLNSIGGRIKRKNGQQILPQLRESIEALLPQAQEKAQAPLEDIRGQARQAVSDHYNGEIATLEALEATSAELRDREIAHLQQRRDQALAAADRAEVQLEGLRVVRTT